MTTIIYAHPWSGSFNKAILDTIITTLNASNKKYQLIDLNVDQFNPVMTQNELALFAKGQSLDPLVEKYQTMLLNTSELIIIFPIWWFNMPAILKGFFDKVMLKNFAYTESPLGLKGKLSHIQKTTVITTSNSPKWYIRLIAGNPIQGGLIHTTLKGVGIKPVKWLHCSYTKKEQLNKRVQFLDQVNRRISK